MSAKQVVLASHNAHKIAEFQGIIADVRADLNVTAYTGPEPVETGTTFAENALIKARAAAKHHGLTALADDSGLCVDLLGGSPGVFSAYWAGHTKNDEANRLLLLDQISDIAESGLRTAHFVSVIAVVQPSGEEHVVEGIWPGRLALEPRGEQGFGYDPIFIPDQQDGKPGERTAAELTATEKNAQSHRARAFQSLIPYLAAL